MNLNRKLWHARWYTLLNGHYPPDNLCDYVWGFMWENFVLLLKIAIPLAALTIISLFIYQTWPNGLYGILGAMGVIFGVIFTSLTIHWIANKESYRESSGIIKEYIKAKKERYCPRIEWEE